MIQSRAALPSVTTSFVMATGFAVAPERRHRVGVDSVIRGKLDDLRY